VGGWEGKGKGQRRGNFADGRKDKVKVKGKRERKKGKKIEIESGWNELCDRRTVSTKTIEIVDEPALDLLFDGGVQFTHARRNDTAHPGAATWAHRAIGVASSPCAGSSCSGVARGGGGASGDGGGERCRGGRDRGGGGGGCREGAGGEASIERGSEVGVEGRVGMGLGAKGGRGMRGVLLDRSGLGVERIAGGVVDRERRKGVRMEVALWLCLGRARARWRIAGG
jgi:hypothetical protein